MVRLRACPMAHEPEKVAAPPQTRASVSFAIITSTMQPQCWQPSQNKPLQPVWPHVSNSRLATFYARPRNFTGLFRSPVHSEQYATIGFPDSISRVFSQSTVAIIRVLRARSN